MKYHRFISIAIILSLVHISVLCAPAYAIEPQRPEVNKIFSPEKEEKINSLTLLTTREAFYALEDAEFLINRDLTYKAIHTAFNDRRAEAIAQAQNYLKLPLIEFVDGRRITNVRDFNIAKKIFEVFPDESTPILTTLYNSSDEITRGNIVRAAGGVSGGPPIKDMLVKALEDKSFAEEEIPEMVGEPLRVCDISYNQLVLRYAVRNVLRTIANEHDIETRDHHINILKSQMGLN